VISSFRGPVGQASLVPAASARETWPDRSLQSRLGGFRFDDWVGTDGKLTPIPSQMTVSTIRVFGSVARGDNDASSDVDTSVDVVTERGLRPRVRERVLAETTLL
jgi:hypothetical protein